jgi:hypothetical protein
MRDLRVVALHEAGHAVMAWLLYYEGIRIEEVTIVRDGDNDGRTSYTLDLSGPWTPYMGLPEAKKKAGAGRACAKVALAGWIAEVMATWPTDREVEPNPTEDCDNAAADLAGSGCPEDWEELVEPVSAELLRNWHRVLALADELVVLGSLSDLEVASVMFAAIPQPDMQKPQPLTVMWQPL